ncbi:DsbA family protein [Sphingomonas aracearum]|uniref:Thioredoxin-like fold domain-containing protein n=1 Tax=Sphingomonas aracearum TaxID=2283317 RepID=A0A369W1P9_9SPHN|nr:thioredoxin domain-containing protein [Sphingomonas aracearum]RDE07280.1 hypothetical protein DVW87_06540 [Sphingomonas aracearum]
MKRLLLLLALLLPALASAAPPDWTRTATPAPSGAFVIGNPRAPVLLIEYLSYTCPHCAAFNAESKPELKDRLVRSGRVRIELRHATRDGLDLAATMVARCAGARFSEASDAIFAAQPDWFERGQQYLEENRRRLSAYDTADRLRALSDGAGLTQIAASVGVTEPRLAACFANAADLAKVARMSEAAWSTISGTPSFVVAGKLVPPTNWAGLKPALAAAGAK